jgi:hypothetical protein
MIGFHVVLVIVFVVSMLIWGLQSLELVQIPRGGIFAWLSVLALALLTGVLVH